VSKKEDNTSNKDLIWGKDASILSGGSTKTVKNHIYFYEGVTHGSILNLTEHLRKAEAEMKVVSAHHDIEPPPIHLHISSYGGSVFAGFAGMDTIRSCSVPVHTIVEGVSASAATLLSVVGKKRLIRRSAYMLIHELSTGMCGKLTEIKDRVENSEKLMATIREVYDKHARIPEDRLSELLQHDWYFGAEDCQKMGLADEVVD